MILERPGFLWLLAAAIPLAAAFLASRRRRRMEVPDLEVWRAVARAQRPARGAAVVRDGVSLLLLLGALAAATLAAASPAPHAAPPVDWALVFDTSASMGASDGRHARAVAAADAFVRGLPAGDRVRVLEAGAVARARGPWRRAGEPLPLPSLPDERRADWEGALERAREGVRPEADLRVVAFSDGPVPGAAFAPAVATATGNLAVADLAWARPWNSTWIDVSARVRNCGSDTRGATLLLSCGSRLELPVPPLAPGDETTLHGRLNAPAGGVLAARLAGGDALAVDDAAFAAVPPLRPPRLLVVAPAGRSPFFQAALAALAPGLDDASGIAVPGPAADAAAALADLAFWDRTGPATTPGTAVFVASAAGPARIPADVLTPAVTGWAAGHPLLAGLDLSRLRVSRARPFLRAPDLDVLVDSAAGPLLVARLSGPSPCVALAFALEDSNLPLLAALPLLVRNSVTLLTADRPFPDLHTGEPLLPFPTGEWIVDDGSGPRRGEGPWVAPSPGVFVFSQGGRSRPAAVHFNCPDESQMAPAPPGRELPPHPAAPVPPWIPLTGVAAAAAALEALLSRLRRPRGAVAPTAPR